MERRDQRASFLRGKEHEAGLSLPSMPESTAKIVLVGAFDVAKEVVKSQSPAAWNEWLIEQTNLHVVPHLNPVQLLWVMRHKKEIEQAAHHAGIAITTAEIVVATLIVGKAVKKIKRHMHRQSPDLDVTKQIEKKFEHVVASDYVPMPIIPAIYPDGYSSFQTKLRNALGQHAPLTNREYEQSFLTVVNDIYDPNPGPRIWAGRVGRRFERLFHPTTIELRQFEGTMEELIIRSRRLNNENLRLWDIMYRLAHSNQPEDAIPILRRLYFDAFTLAAFRPESPLRQAPMSQIRRAAMASFQQWRELEFSGLYEVLRHTQDRIPKDGLINAVRALRSVDTPITLAQRVAEYIQHPLHPREMQLLLSDPAWADAMARLPNYTIQVEKAIKRHEKKAETKRIY